MSAVSLGYSNRSLPLSKKTKKDRKRKSGSSVNDKIKSFCSPGKRLRSLRRNAQIEHENLQMEPSDEKVEDLGKVNGAKRNSKTLLINRSANETISQEGDRELICRICRKQFHELNDLALHEKIPHFWSCTHRGCELAFETKVDRKAHVEEFHSADRFTGGNAALDHLVMNSDGTMSFNYLTSATN